MAPRRPASICPHCNGPLIEGQNIGPLFAAKPVQWLEHPVPSKPIVLRGEIPLDGSPPRTDMCLADQLRQRAAMGGPKQKAELAAFEELFAKTLADALVVR